MATVSDSQPRPRHTTLAAGLVIGGSVGVVVSVAEQLAGLQSLETRERVTDFLSTSPGDGLGLDVESSLGMLRVVFMLLAGCATAAGVLGFHAMRGGTRARLGLSVLAVPIFLGGLATGGFLTSLVAAGAALMWVGPSALWFRGEPIPEPASPSASRAQQIRQPPAATRVPFAQADPQADPQSDPSTAAPVRPAAAVITRRPDAVVWACVLTWAFSALTLVVMAASVVLMTTNPDLVLDELVRQNGDLAGSDAAQLTDATYATAAVAGGWSLAAMVLAVLAYRRVGWARWGVLSSAAVAGVVCLVAILSSLLLVVPAAASLTTVVLLSRPEVRAWFNRT